MTPAQRAAKLRVAATAHQFTAARLRCEAAAIETAAKMEALAQAIQSGFDHDVAAHPDLAEMNVVLDAMYGA